MEPKREAIQTSFRMLEKGQFDIWTMRIVCTCVSTYPTSKEEKWNVAWLRSPGEG